MEIKNYNDFDFDKSPLAHADIIKTGKKHKNIIDIVTAFDTETTAINELQQSFVYVWQFGFKDTVYMGRSLSEAVSLFENIASHLNEDDKLIVYVHNLSYDFQFLKGYYHFNADEVFALDKRKILKCTMFDGKIELRCSYIHSNMSLDNFAKKWAVIYQKQDGEDFDYHKFRTAETPLTDDELKYCACDILALCEALENEMRHDGDTLATIPLTVTGYMRRDVKRIYHEISYNKRKSLMPTGELFFNYGKRSEEETRTPTVILRGRLLKMYIQLTARQVIQTAWSMINFHLRRFSASRLRLLQKALIGLDKMIERCYSECTYQI